MTFPSYCTRRRSTDSEGATVDYVDRVNESGFEVRTRDTASADGAEATTAQPATLPTGEIADRVREVLDNNVNPAIAAHGGFISLIDVHDTEISVEMRRWMPGLRALAPRRCGKV